MSPDKRFFVLEKSDIYRIDLKGMHDSAAHYDFLLDNQFFFDMEGMDVQKGNVNVSLDIHKAGGSYKLNFQVEGFVLVPCDRCLDDMELPVESNEYLVVKLGTEYEELADNVIVVPENEGYIDVAWFMYELVALSIPIKHVHPSGQCNEEMNRVLREHLCVETSGDESLEEEEMKSFKAASAGDISSDPRWCELKKLLDNN